MAAGERRTLRAFGLLDAHVVTILTLLVAAGGVAAGRAAAGLPSSSAQHGGLVPALLVAVGFALSEVFVVHLHVRRNSHSFSLSELPLMLGLFFVTAPALVVGAVSGAAAALVIHRRQHVLKVLFNTAKGAIEIAAALFVFHAVCPMGTMTGNAEVAAALAAALAYSFVGATLVSLVIAVSERSWKSARLVATLPISALGTLTAASLGLVAVIVVEVSPATVWLLAVPAVGCYALYAAWTKQSRRLESLGFLYRTAQMLQEHDSIDDAIRGLLRETRDLLRARSIEVLYEPGGGQAAVHARFTDGDESRLGACDGERVRSLTAILDDSHEAQLVAIDDCPALAEHFGDLTHGTAVIAPLIVSDRVVGVFLASPPVTRLAQLTEDERRLVDTTARALSVSLEKGSLEASLRKLRTLEEQLVHQAYHDPLTRLPNRARFIERLTEVTRSAPADGAAFAILFIDLDDFKTVNDSLGHDAGDALLVEVGKRIGSSLRPGDVAARLGGDEFAVLVHQIHDDAAAEAAAVRFLEPLTRPVSIAGHETRVSASIGVSIGTAGDDVSALVKGADVAMYNAKAGGKNRVAVFHSAMHEETMSRYQLLQDVQVAHERGELSVAYQPIVNLATGRVGSIEALIRWDHPDLGRIPPDVFVRLAEENRAIGDITLLVLRDACTQLQRYGPDALPRASINVSARDLGAVDLVEAVAATTTELGVDPARLMCEVTESLLVEEHAAETLHALRGLGVKVALDDFGTGYSSLQVLRRLPLDEIKIAKPFIDDVELDPAAAAFVRAITTLGKTVGLHVVAEGVERPAQVTELRAAGCDAAQGFLFSRPMGAGDLETYLEAPRAESTGLVSGADTADPSRLAAVTP